jgi:hypothetical protein
MFMGRVGRTVFIMGEAQTITPPVLRMGAIVFIAIRPLFINRIPVQVLINNIDSVLYLINLSRKSVLKRNI